MGWLPVLLGGIAAYVFGPAERPFLCGLSVLAALGAFWSWGAMDNYAREAARRRRAFVVQNMKIEGRTSADIQAIESQPVHLTARDAQAAPDNIAHVNMVCSLSALVLFAWALVSAFV
jgi:hypothetical protein